jgi:hypothetical protein
MRHPEIACFLDVPHLVYIVNIVGWLVIICCKGILGFMR